MNHRVTVRVTTPLNPTEVQERVEQAVLNLFPNATITERHGELLAETHSLEHFRERLREQAIVDTARDVFLQNREAEGFSFRLRKQPAYQGIVNFAVGNPSELGDITVWVHVEDPDVETFIDHVAPRTEP